MSESNFRTYASARLFGDALIPGHITQILGIQPEYAAAKGQRKISRSGQVRIDHTGKWILSSNHLASKVLEEHIQWLVDILDRAGTPAMQLGGVERCDIFCYWFSDRGHGGPEFSPKLMGRLAYHGLSLGLDCYSLPAADATTCDEAGAATTQVLRTHG